MKEKILFDETIITCDVCKRELELEAPYVLSLRCRWKLQQMVTNMFIENRDKHICERCMNRLMVMVRKEDKQ